MDKERLQGKVAVITGGGKGIGQAIAKRFATEGAKVAVWEQDEDAAADTVAAINEAGGSAQAFPCDVSDQEGYESSQETND